MNSFFEQLFAYAWNRMVARPADPTNPNSLRVLSENPTERPLLRYFLHSLKREEPTLVTAIRLAGDAAEVGGCGGAGLRLNWAGHGQRLDEGVGVSGIPGL